MVTMINKILIRFNICIFAFTLGKYSFVIYSVNSKPVKDKDKTNFGYFSIECLDDLDELFNFTIG